MTDNDIDKKKQMMIKNALIFYDENNEKNNEFLKKIKYIKMINNETKNDILSLYDKNYKMILQSPWEILAIYLPNQHIWKWGWSIPSFPQKYTFISRKILEYAFNLETDKEFFLRSKLINSKIDIVNNLQIDINIAIASYISKQSFILKYSNRADEQDNDGFFEFKNVFDDFNEEYMIIYFIILQS